MAERTIKPAAKKTVRKAPVGVGTQAKDDKTAGISVPVFGVDGKLSGKTKFPASMLTDKVNTELLAQSVRVYLSNQREGMAKTKTRGEVEGSTRKIYRQKGTGKARHGSIRAPIFVGGGIVFGPKPRDYRLKLSKSMKRQALKSAFTAQAEKMIVVDGMESVEPKTKNVVTLLTAMNVTGKALLVVTADARDLIRASKNIENVDIIGAKDLYPYALLTHTHIVFTKKSLEESQKHFV